MNALRILHLRWLPIGALSVAILLGIVGVGLALWGLPTPPAMTTEHAPRVSWKWVWKSAGQVRRIQASRRFAGWLPGQSAVLVHVGTPGAVHIVDHPGGAPTRLKGLPGRARYLVQSRFTERPYFVFSLDEGGSERYVHYRFDLERGTYQPLTTVPARSYVGGFDGDGRRVIYASTRRNQEDFDLYVVDVTNPASDTRVLEADGEFWSAALSADGRSALVARTMSHTSNLVYMLDLETRGMRPLFAEAGVAIGLWAAEWSRDGRSLYVATELDREFVGVHAVDPTSGDATLLTPELNWDVDGIELLPDDRTLALLVNEDARRSLYLLDTVSGQLTAASGPPAGQIAKKSLPIRGLR
jgi:hypothetical protein